MSGTVSVKVRNKDKLFGVLKRNLVVSIDREMTAAAEESGQEMVDLARKLAPERKARSRRKAKGKNGGALKTSIVMTKAGEQAPAHSQPGGAQVVPEGSVLVTAGNSAVRYAHLAEFGAPPHDVSQGSGTKSGRLRRKILGGSRMHPGHKGQPFFWPAYRIIRKKMRARFGRRLSKAVKATTT